jgi:hypothetical protein
MEVLTFLVPAVMGGAALVFGAWLSHWRWRNRLGLQGRPSTHTGAITHRWTVASREEVAGGTRVVFRCEQCGALEVREMP